MSDTLLASGERTARKQHRCWHDCGEKIEPGTRYAYSTSKYEGDVSTFKSHIGCDWLWLTLNELRDNGDEDYEEAREEFLESDFTVDQVTTATARKVEFTSIPRSEQARIRRLLWKWDEDRSEARQKSNHYFLPME